VRRGVHSVLVGKPKGKRPLGIPRRRWEDNVKMDLVAVGFVSTLRIFFKKCTVQEATSYCRPNW
jgi:hypothetical protein